MNGHINGVKTQILKEVPAAYPVHCFAHCINLCLQDVGRKIKSIRDALDLAQDIGKLITYSPKQFGLFAEKKGEFSPEAQTIRTLL